MFYSSSNKAFRGQVHPKLLMYFVSICKYFIKDLESLRHFQVLRITNTFLLHLMLETDERNKKRQNFYICCNLRIIRPAVKLLDMRVEPIRRRRLEVGTKNELAIFFIIAEIRANNKKVSIFFH